MCSRFPISLGSSKANKNLKHKRNEQIPQLYSEVSCLPAIFAIIIFVRFYSLFLQAKHANRNETTRNMRTIEQPKNFHINFNKNKFATYSHHFFDCAK